MGEKVCCFTGHRPNSFPWKDNIKDPRLYILLKRIEQAVDTALSLNVRRFICGNALGVDTWAAQIVLGKKKLNPEIYLEIALPFLTHNSDSPVCIEIQKEADCTHVVATERNRTAAFFQRNKYMVDHSDLIIAVYDDQKNRRSGTQKTLEMAKKKGLEIIQIPWGDI